LLALEERDTKKSRAYLLPPIENVPVLACQATPETTWDVQINSSTNVEIQYIPWSTKKKSLISPISVDPSRRKKWK